MAEENIRKILVVDDEETVRDFCRTLLTEAGYQVEIAVNGLDALDKLKDSTFDLVITDINMPELDGIGLYLNSVREHTYLHNRFLFMSGNLSINEHATSIILQIGRGIIRKPFEIKDFLGAIEELTIEPPC
jgi:DNA-binding response OmpR family regulator